MITEIQINLKSCKLLYNINTYYGEDVISFVSLRFYFPMISNIGYYQYFQYLQCFMGSALPTPDLRNKNKGYRHKNKYTVIIVEISFFPVLSIHLYFLILAPIRLIHYTINRFIGAYSYIVCLFRREVF